jgi:hypothetical protein
MSKPLAVLPKSAFLILFALAAMPVFAQHGGGGGGGGHMGGGGGFHGGGGGGSHAGGGGSFHGGGGGFHSGGGGFHGGSVAPPAAGYGAPRASGPPSFRSGRGSGPRPGYGGFSRPGSTYAGGGQGFGNSGSGAPAGRNGQWHSFAPPSGGREPSPGAAAGAQSANGGGHVISGNHPGAPGAVRSFSGQGREVWESSASRNVVSRSQSLSTMHNSLGTSLFTRPGLSSGAAMSRSTRFTSGSPLLASRGFAGGVNTASSFQHIRGFGFNQFGHPINGRRGGFRQGCWNCGFGFGNRWGGGFGWGGWGWGGWGLGWGWGWPGLGFWGWDPFWVDPWWGWSGYSGYPANNYYIYNYSGSDNYAPQDNSVAPENNQYEEEDNQGTSNGNWVTPNGPNPSAAPSSSGLTVPVLIYMKSGSVLTVRDYWMIDGELHYITMSGVQKTADLEQVDLARSNSENAKSGVRFIFKSEPSAQPPDEAPAPPAAQPDSAPGVGPQPEART